MITRLISSKSTIPAFIFLMLILAPCYANAWTVNSVDPLYPSIIHWDAAEQGVVVEWKELLPEIYLLRLSKSTNSESETMSNPLINLKVRIIPDFDCPDFDGHIINIADPDEVSIIIKFPEPFTDNEKKYLFLVASPRHEGVSINSLLNGVSLLCNFIGLPLDKYESENPFDTSWWRGGGSFIGTIDPSIKPETT